MIEFALILLLSILPMMVALIAVRAALPTLTRASDDAPEVHILINDYSMESECDFQGAACGKRQSRGTEERQFEQPSWRGQGASLGMIWFRRVRRRSRLRVGMILTVTWDQTTVAKNTDNYGDMALAA